MDWIAAAFVLLGFFLFDDDNPLGHILYLTGETLYLFWAITVVSPPGWGLAFVSAAFFALGIRDWIKRGHPVF